MSSVIAALTLMELGQMAPNSLLNGIRALANNGKTGGSFDKDLNKRLLGVYYKAVDQRKKQQSTLDAEEKRQDEEVHQSLQAQVTILQMQIQELSLNREHKKTQ